jgi:thioredoxin 1
MSKYALKNIDELESLKKTYNKILIQFSANWCGPCRKITPEIQFLMDNNNKDDVTYIYCDIDQHDKLANNFQVSCIPSFSIYDRQTNSYLIGDQMKTESDINKLKLFLIENDIIDEENTSNSTVKVCSS